ncbi:unnamed protein product, partial [Amoebophrya sp. A25]
VRQAWNALLNEHSGSHYSWATAHGRRSSVGVAVGITDSASSPDTFWIAGHGLRQDFEEIRRSRLLTSA